ncbi:hypothetical protein [Magnetospirillum sp. 64-120]|uniref:hypothetical protein n=1 Tax=Magnetospirillum sp. 64-120 TaxID=1895778 RepID=UPI0009279034|nr:hypothetical protein [Magnetospirillum sp. 64-120]OJX81261.1 MAG: hypothetical protein BGO92_09450 [Magnetospirillum sp. 64-120]
MTEPAPAFVIHHLEHGRAALTAAEGRPVLLISPPGAAGYQGISWWQALVTALRSEFPQADFTPVLDCADCPGWALAALRMGVEKVLLCGEGPAFQAVREVAEQKAAWGEGRWGNDSLDLLGDSFPVRSCRDHGQRLWGRIVDAADPGPG